MFRARSCFSKIRPKLILHQRSLAAAKILQVSALQSSFISKTCKIEISEGFSFLEIKDL
jgi:hypothetical protein